MRWRGLLTAVTIGAVVLAGCGDDGDDGAAESTTTTTEDTTTTESTSTTTTEQATTTTTTEPDAVELADFEGSWEGTSFTVTSKENPALSIDAITFGATVTGDVDDSGNLTGLLGVPEALGGGPEPVPFAASFELIDAETMTTTFEEEIPPFLTSFTGPFTFDGTTLAITDEEAVFDFTDGAGPVPATAVIVLERATGRSEVAIEVLEEEDPGGMGPFTASGAAVDDGVLCAAGDAMIVRFFDADTREPPPWPQDPTSLLVDWEYTCDDGSGTFTLQLAQPAYTDEDHARFRASGGSGEIHGEGSTWTTQSGTDSYTTLTGEGTYTFEVLDPSGRPAQATWIGTLSTS